MADFFTNYFNTLGHFLVGYMVPFLFVLTIIVFFHELGHFLVARWVGVRVLTFSLGFGPEIIGFNDSHGTRWKISAIPLGGYVKFFGDESEASTPDNEALSRMSAAERAQSFQGQKVASRAAIVVAGPVANFLLAIVIFSVGFAILGKPSIPAEVDSVLPDSAAEHAGFQHGDLVLAIDGSRIETFTDMQRVVTTSAGQKLTFTIKRGDKTITLDAVPALKEQKDRFGNVFRIGQLGIGRSSSPGEVLTTPVDPFTAVWLGVKETGFMIEQTLSSVGRMISGRESADQMGGPIRIAQMSGQVATLGFSSLIHWSAVLSISIGLLNLFPVPLLDGGHLLFYAVEAVRGRRVSDRAQEMSFRFGLALVLMLMVFATYNDILHLAKPGGF